MRLKKALDRALVVAAAALGFPGSEDDLSSMRLKEALDRALVAAAAVLGAGLVLLRLASYGPFMWWDPVNYVTVARNLLAGDGFVGMGGPLVSWPPLYPALLAGGGLFGLDPYAFAGPLNAVIFGLTVLVAGWWLRRHMHSRLLWLWGCISIALALPLVEIASHAMSEAAFILFITLALTQIDAHLKGGGRASLMWAAAFSALACLTRYIGVFVVLAVVPMLLAARVAPLEKMKRIVVYMLIAAAPLGLWMLRNFLVDGSTTGGRGKGSYSFSFIVDEFWRLAVGDWWLFGLTAPFLLALVMAAGLAFLRRLDRKRDAPVASDVAWGPLRVCGGFALAYLTMLAAAMMSGGTWDGLQWRFLTPAYIPLLLAALLLMDGALRYARKRVATGNRSEPSAISSYRIGGRQTLAAVLVLALFLQAAWLVVLHNRELTAWNAGVKQGFAGPRWRNSESVQYLRGEALTGAMLSNAQVVTGLHVDGPARHYALPCEPDGLQSALLKAAEIGEVHVLYFDDRWAGCSRQQYDDLQNALSRDPLLELAAELADGKVYRLREREFWPAAMFRSSNVPVEGKPFGAFLNESHGRELPGEQWRWEKGGDADGWTSLPVQQPTYVYTPTVADVGHRLRASVYYVDQLGNRLKAITKPSEPVQPDIQRMVSEPLGSEDGKGEAWTSEAERIIRSRYDVYLYENRLIYGKRSCIWEDEYGTRFPLSVYSLDSESGTLERDTLDFAWSKSSWKYDGTCVVERQLPDKDIFTIRTGQVDPDGNLLWEAEHWFEENRRWFDGYLSSLTFGEPAARGVFDIYLGMGGLVFVKDPCVAEDTGPSFFVHLVPADTEDLPSHRQQYGFDNLDFVFQWYGLMQGGRCMAVRALPEYDVVSIRVGQYEGDTEFWSEEISVP